MTSFSWLTSFLLHLRRRVEGVPLIDRARFRAPCKVTAALKVAMGHIFQQAEHGNVRIEPTTRREERKERHHNELRITSTNILTPRVEPQRVVCFCRFLSHTELVIRDVSCKRLWQYWDGRVGRGEVDVWMRHESPLLVVI